MSRITGLATGLDVDAVVKETMQAYQSKIDVVDQQKKIAELQQQLYRDVIKECRDFYNDYFDITKNDSLLKPSNWTGVSFTSSSNAVVVTGGSKAEVENYEVTVSQLATPAMHILKPADAVGKIYINNIEIDLTNAKDNSEKVNIINSALKDQGITAKYSEISQGIVLSTNKTGENQRMTISLVAPSELGKISKDDLAKKIEDFNNNGIDFQIGSNIKVSKKSNSDTVDIEVNGKIISIDGKDGITEEKIKNAINSNSELKKEGISAEIDSNGEFRVLEKDSSAEMKIGDNCKATIGNGVAKPLTIDIENNSITLDGVKFEFNNITTQPAQITGKVDVSSVKDKVVKFVNDYNKLLEKLNTLVNEKRDNNYMPLTDAQKKEMSESEIELWEKKVKEGQLSRDSDLKRIISGMKSAMSAMMGQKPDQFGLSSMGITLVSDYSGSKAGTLKIDEKKLDEALQENMEKVQNLFTSAGTKDPTTGKYVDRGIMFQLRDLFDKETQNSSGALLKKAGIEGSSTASNNTLTTKISKYEQKISKMKSLFYTKQQALYTKYATLETMMNKLNAQMNSLSSMFSS